MRHEATGNSNKVQIFGFALCAVLIALSFSAEAQQPKKVFRIGYLSALDPARESARSESIREALRDLGYIEGYNIAIEYRYGEEKRDRPPQLAAELVRLKVDIIVVSGGGGWVQAVKNATKTIPIVMMGVGPDPVKAGLIDTLARPGGNVTGVTNLNPELGGKRLELLKEAVPKLARVAVLYDPAVTSSVLEVKENLPVAARALRLTLQPWEVRGGDNFDRAFAAMIKQRPDGLYAHPSGPWAFAHGKQIAGFALKSRLPSVYGRREAVEAGGLLSYGADIATSYRRVAYYVDRILKGAKPAELPVEQPMKFEFIVNLKTAKQIGVTIPPEVLARANRLIK
ncbi:MAG TPA: ABC transporter substrate-binding protein [Candidatus Binatia bacterium]|nr:ABC transporter substrate-binding protein [Candidatus Binatia bacterium]